jgi:putative transposase
MHTPSNVHHARAPAIQAARARVLTTAYAAHPERFVRRHPQPPTFPTTSWINEPEKETANSMNTERN